MSAMPTKMTNQLFVQSMQQHSEQPSSLESATFVSVVSFRLKFVHNLSFSLGVLFLA